MTRTFLSLLLLLPAVAFGQTTKPWLGMHVLIDGGEDMDKLEKSIKPLSKMGVNVLIIEVAYNFDFKSQPDLAGKDPITQAAAARKIAELCRQHNIRPIPEINCLGHQSWHDKTLQLLKKYPEFDESPTKPWDKDKNPGVKSWCSLHPDVTKVVFPMIDEVIDAFAADAFHVGFDEVFKIGDDSCPRCKGKDPAELYANEVKEFHDHIVGEKKIEMLMWADRLLDGKAMNYGIWEGSGNGTWPAVDKIPKDIIVCDWHYEVLPEYPSIAYLLDKGFRVWPTGWHKADATKTFLDAAMGYRDNPRMLGYLNSTWYKVKPDVLHTFEPLKISSEKLGVKQEVAPKS